MKKLFRNRTFLGIGSIALAVLICLVIAPALSTSNSKQVNVVRVTKKIPESALITKDMHRYGVMDLDIAINMMLRKNLITLWNVEEQAGEVK